MLGEFQRSKLRFWIVTPLYRLILIERPELRVVKPSVDCCHLRPQLLGKLRDEGAVVLVLAGAIVDYASLMTAFVLGVVVDVS